MKTLYDVTGKITDINTLLINKNVLDNLYADAARYQYTLDTDYLGRSWYGVGGKEAQDAYIRKMHDDSIRILKETE